MCAESTSEKVYLIFDHFILYKNHIATYEGENLKYLINLQNQWHQWPLYITETLRTL